MTHGLQSTAGCRRWLLGFVQNHWLVSTLTETVCHKLFLCQWRTSSQATWLQFRLDWVEDGFHQASHWSLQNTLKSLSMASWTSDTGMMYWCRVTPCLATTSCLPVVYSTKSRGLRTEPCGMPYSTGRIATVRHFLCSTIIIIIIKDIYIAQNCRGPLMRSWSHPLKSSFLETKFPLQPH